MVYCMQWYSVQVVEERKRLQNTSRKENRQMVQ